MTLPVHGISKIILSGLQGRVLRLACGYLRSSGPGSLRESLGSLVPWVSAKVGLVEFCQAIMGVSCSAKIHMGTAVHTTDAGGILHLFLMLINVNRSILVAVYWYIPNSKAWKLPRYATPTSNFYVTTTPTSSTMLSGRPIMIGIPELSTSKWTNRLHKGCNASGYRAGFLERHWLLVAAAGPAPYPNMLVTLDLLLVTRLRILNVTIESPHDRWSLTTIKHFFCRCKQNIHMVHVYPSSINNYWKNTKQPLQTVKKNMSYQTLVTPLQLVTFTVLNRNSPLWLVFFNHNLLWLAIINHHQPCL